MTFEALFVSEHSFIFDLVIFDCFGVVVGFFNHLFQTFIDMFFSFITEHQIRNTDTESIVNEEVTYQSLGVIKKSGCFFRADVVKHGVYDSRGHFLKGIFV